MTTFTNRLHELRLIQMRALTHQDDIEQHRVVYHDDRINIRNEFGSGWNFFAYEQGDEPAYQTLLWIKQVETDLNARDWDMSNPDDLLVAVRAYNAATVAAGG